MQLAKVSNIFINSHKLATLRTYLKLEECSVCPTHSSARVNEIENVQIAAIFPEAEQTNAITTVNEYYQTQPLGKSGVR